MKVTYDPHALRRIRTLTGKSPAYLANRAGVSRQSIYMYERGAQEPGARVLAKLASSLGVSVSAFFTER